MPRTDLSPESVAEAIERARIELLHQGPWSEIRESERAARIALLTTAMADGGVTAGIAELTARAAAVDDLTARLADHRASSAAERRGHEQEVAALRAQVADLTDRLALAEARHADAEDYARQLNDLMLGAEPDAVAAEPARRGFLTRMRSTARR